MIKKVKRINDWCEKIFKDLSKVVGEYWSLTLSAFIIGAVLLAVVAGVLHLVFGWRWADWMGLGEYTGSLAKDQRGKTLWDWLELLIIPAVLAVVALFFNRQERQNELKIAENHTQDDVLQNYFDKMGELFLEKNLMQIVNMQHDSATLPLTIGEELFERIPDDLRPVWNIAQVRTVTALRQLNGDRRNFVFQFLSDANLSGILLVRASIGSIDLSNTFLGGIDLSHTQLQKANLSNAYMESVLLIGANLGGADLSSAFLGDAVLKKTILCGTNFSKAILRRTDLSDALLNRANLQYAYAVEANFSNSDVSGVDLYKADLKSANLCKAKLSESNLREADLRGANLRNAQLEGATLLKCNLSGAQLCRADLYIADLAGATIRGADLSDAILAGADLTDANLSGTTFTEANLTGSIFDRANLKGAKITEEQLASVRSLKGAIMPDGKKYDPAIHNSTEIKTTVHNQ